MQWIYRFTSEVSIVLTLSCPWWHHTMSLKKHILPVCKMSWELLLRLWLFWTKQLEKQPEETERLWLAEPLCKQQNVPGRERVKCHTEMGTEAKKASQALLIKMEFKKFSLSLSFSLSLDFWSFVLKYVWKLQKHNVLCPAVSVSDFMDKSWMCGKSIKYVKCQLFVGNGWNIAIPWEAQIWRGGGKKNLFWYA